MAIRQGARQQAEYHGNWPFSRHLKRMLATAGHSWATAEHAVFGRRIKRFFGKGFGWLAVLVPWRLQLWFPRSLERRRWRLTYKALAFILLIVLPVALIVRHDLIAQRYVLSAATRQLVGPPVVQLDKQLTYHAKTGQYQYNPGAANGIKAPSDGKGDQGLAIGGAKYYGVSLAKRADGGQTYTDAATKLSFSLVPKFGQLDGKHLDGHVVYPFGQGQVVYTLKDNGLKEDVVIAKPTNSATLTYQLQLPDTLEAKLQPDGSIGIFSANPALFGNISYGSDKDQQAVQKARTSGEKTNLVFTIPAPVIKQSGGQMAGPQAKFSLDGNALTVTATHLQNLSYPIAIDPSVVVQSANGFTSGNDEDNSSLISTSSVSRGALTGGALGTWASANTGTTFGARSGVTTIAYNGYLYAVGGSPSAATSLTDVYYAPLLSNGQVGNWTQTNSILVSRTTTSLITYNGYLYMVGGNNLGNTPFDDAEYALICTGSNTGKGGCSSTAGSLGTWLYANGTATQGGSAGSSVDGSRLNKAVSLAMTVAYNDTMYVMGGCTQQPIACTAETNVVQVAHIRGDGTLSTWVNQGTLPTNRYGGGAAAYNNHIYILGGCTALGINCTASTGDTIIAPINSDGTLGSWATSAYTFASPYVGISAYVYRGYLYYFDGSTGGTNANYAQYAPIYASGLIGPWSTTSTFATPTSNAGYTVYNGYAYQVGGCTASSTNCNTYTNTIASAAINSTGATGTYQTSPNTIETDGIFDATSVAYGGHLYILGGANGYNVNSAVSNVYYTTLNADGSTGSWGTTSPFTTARLGPAAVAYNGYMYVMGGYHTGSDTSCSAASAQYCDDVQKAAINSDGTLGTWSSVGSRYSATGRAFLGAAAYDGYLYIMGGDYNNNSSVSAETDVGQIQSDGSIASWTTTGSLVQSQSEFAVAQAGPYVYLLGGRLGGGSVYNNYIQYATLTSGGTTTWASANNFFTNARNNLTGGASNGFVYITGGQYGAGTNNYNDTQYARICMDTSTTDGCNGTVGTLGTWHATSSFTTARGGQAGTIYNGYIYVMGGCSNWGLFGNCGSSATLLNDLQYAPLNNGGPGSTGSWSSTSSFNSVRQGAKSVAYDGYLYVLGGQSNVGQAFSYTGASQTYTVPAGLTKLTIEAYGAQGGTGCTPSAAAGLGGYARETINVTPGETLQINVGGQGGNGACSGTTAGGTGGFGGGGTGGTNGSNGSASSGGGGGGGASDVRQAGTALSNRVLVAGGGGGGGSSSSSATGGGGGDTSGAAGGGGGGGGGTQSAGGAAGGNDSTAGGTPTQDKGGTGGSRSALGGISGGGGGGGGYYGGGGGGDNTGSIGGGGGGSGYVLPTATNGTMQTGQRSGNGLVNILLPTYFNDVQYAKISATGALASDAGCGSAWCTTTSFGTARSNFAAQVYNGYLYIMGGENSTTHFNDVQYAKLTSSGAIAANSGCGSAWCTSSSFATARSGLSSAINNGYLYLLGGTDGSSVYNTVQYAQLTSTGALASDAGCGSAWCTTTGFTTARSGHTSVVNNGYVYVLGGTNGTNLYSDTQYAKLNSNGAISSNSGCGSAWCTTTAFPIARSGHTSWVYDGYMYVAGGLSSSSTYLNDVQFAPILPGGVLGNWQSGTTTFSTARGSQASAVYNGYAYILGGCTSGSPCITYANDVQYAPLQSIPRIAHYSRLIDLGSTINGNAGSDPTVTRYSVSASGNGVTNNCISGANVTTKTFGTASCINNITSTSPTVWQNTGRFVFVDVTLDDTQSATFPDSSGSPATLNEVDMYFHPSPDRRLRGGKTFTDMNAGQSKNGIPSQQILDTGGTL